MKKIVVQPRQTGKTHEAVQWVLAGEKTDYYPGWSRILVCITIEEAARVRRHYAGRGLVYHQVFSWHEWKTARLTPHGQPNVAIDNADLIIAQILGHHPVYLTLTEEVEA